MSKISLIKADISDNKQIHTMQVEAFAPLLQKYQDFEISPAAESLGRVTERFNYPPITHFFILVDGEKIGSIRVRKMGEGLFKLVQIFILPVFQGKGFARQAIQELESIFPDARKWQLNTIKQEEKLTRLYEKMGYIRTGEEEQVKDGMDLVYYEKSVERKE